jgi:RNA polymerase sigma-70 factor (ECF subfamily)
VDYAIITPEALVSACLEKGDGAAWAEFVRRFHPLIAGITIRVARKWNELSRDVVDDLVQEVYLKLCTEGLDRLRDFTPEHPNAMFGFIRTFTANLVHDYFKARESLKRGGGTQSVQVEQAEFLGRTESRRDAGDSVQRDILIREIHACLCQAELGPNAERDRHIFWMYYRLGLPASQIAALPAVGLSTKGVESTILRLTRLLRLRLVEQRSPQRGTGRAGEGNLPAESL